MKRRLDQIPTPRVLRKTISREKIVVSKLPEYHPGGRIELKPVNSSPVIIPAKPKREQNQTTEALEEKNPVSEDKFDPHHPISDLRRKLHNVTRHEMKGNYSLLKFSLGASMRGNAQITIIIGHRGRERLANLVHVLKAFKAYNDPPQIIVVEQDYFPNCRETIELYCDEYLFTYSERPYNRSWAFNCGVNLTQSEFILLHDNDLIPTANYCKDAVILLDKAQGAIPWGTIDYLDPESTENFPQKPWKVLKTINNMGIHGGSIVLRREFFLDIGGMDERFEGWGGEDDAFFEKARKLGRFLRISHLKGNTLTHLWHPPSDRIKPMYERNCSLYGIYNRATLSMVKEIMKDLGPIGDPDKEAIKVREKMKFLSVKSSTEKMKRLHIVYDVTGWAYWYRSEAIKQYAAPGWMITSSTGLPPDLADLDVILLLNYGAITNILGKIRAQIHPPLLVGSLNVGWPRRVDYFFRLRKWCDHLIINNREMYLKCGALPKTSTISNGVDLKLFQPLIPYEERPFRILWTGSTFHARLKGYEILKSLQPRLRKSGYEVDLRLVNSHGKKFTQDEMVQWYNSGRVFVVISESEGTPNPALEAMACGIPVVGTQVGNLPELITHLVDGYLLPNRQKSNIVAGIEYCFEHGARLSKNVLETIQPWDWSLRAKTYFELFDILLSGRQPESAWNIPGNSYPPEITEDRAINSEPNHSILVSHET